MEEKSINNDFLAASGDESSQDAPTGSKRQLGRRNFLKGALSVGAVSAVGALAGCSPRISQGTDSPTPAVPDAEGAAASSTTGAFPGPKMQEFAKPVAGQMAFIADPIPASKIISSEDVDVLVIGAGIAGACAAASCAENGLKVLQVEKTSTFAAHGVAAASLGCRVQKEAGIELDRNTIIGDIMQTGNYRGNADLIVAWADHSAEALDWIVDKIVEPAGIRCHSPWTQIYTESWTNWYPSHINLGEDMFSGMSLVVPEVLAYAERYGAELRYNTPAVQLVQDDSKRVTGAIISTEKGYVQVNASKGVILATGDYANNPERLKKNFRPRDLAGIAFYMNAAQNTGDGHEMGLAVGAAEDEPPHTFLIAGAMTPWLCINKLGKRFMNNRLPYDYASQQIIMQPDATAWSVFGSDYEAAVRQWDAESHWLRDESGGAEAVLGRMTTLEDQVTQGTVLKGETLADLAKQMGVPADTFEATIKEWNEICAAGVDPVYNTVHAYLTPIAQGPYFAQNAGIGGMVTVSGLKVTGESEVIRLDGTVIEGLYAIGNVGGSMFDGTYSHHVNGLSHGRCITFGYLLGKRLSQA